MLPYVQFPAIVSGEAYYSVQLRQQSQETVELALGQLPEGAQPNQAPLNGYKLFELSNIRIHGDGSISGNGQHYWPFWTPTFTLALDDKPAHPTLTVVVAGAPMDNGTKVLSLALADAAKIRKWIDACKFTPA